MYDFYATRMSKKSVVLHNESNDYCLNVHVVHEINCIQMTTVFK